MLPFACVARMTARMMRLWQPQRHRLPASALANLGFGRLRIALEQVGRRNDHAAGATAALHGLLVDEGLLAMDARDVSRVPSPSSVGESR